VFVVSAFDRRRRGNLSRAARVVAEPALVTPSAPKPWLVVWYAEDRLRHVECVDAATRNDAVAFTLRRHPRALSAYAN
jgi:hypothetical protein